MLAVEQLGACVPVSLERIGEAVDALSGQTSIRIENLKASIGVAQAACARLCGSVHLWSNSLCCLPHENLDEECSTLVFEMLKTSGVLAKLPCFAVQIMRLITSVSGQAALIAPVEVMHEVASPVDNWGPSLNIYVRMEVKVLGELLITLFEQMRDETVDSIMLVGHQNCIWLASSLLWLFEDKTCLLINDVVIKGHTGAKLCIRIEPVREVPWRMQVFKASEDPTKFVFVVSEEDINCPSQVPLRSLKSFIQSFLFERV